MTARIRSIDAHDPDPDVLEEAASLLLRGEVIVCPTDSGYALSANGLDKGALQKVFGVKGRSFANPLHVAVATLEDAEQYAEVSETARLLAEAFLPGALTLVMPRKDTVPSRLTAGLPTIGIRIPDNPAILTLARRTRCPITTTSANVSGKETPFSAQEAVDRLEGSLDLVALVLDQGPIVTREVSTLVDVSTPEVRILRQGRIGEEEIRSVLQSRPTSG
jgi:L-threonylcarbamoyladenylate synthase